MRVTTRRRRANRLLAASRALLQFGVVLALASLTVASSSAEAQAGAARAADDQAPLVSMRQVDGQIFQTVSVQPDGTGEVGVFIGEVTSIRYHAFRLTPHALAHVRSLVSGTSSLRRQIFLGASEPSRPFVVDTEYIFAIGPRSIVTDANHAPAPLHRLVVDLAALIDRYSHGLSDHRPGG